MVTTDYLQKYIFALPAFGDVSILTSCPPQVVNSGAGLAFVSYPEVLAKFEFLPQLFAVLFFLMLITLGLGSAVGFMSAVTTTISDSFPSVRKKSILQVRKRFLDALASLDDPRPQGKTSSQDSKLRLGVPCVPDWHCLNILIYGSERKS